MAQDDVSKGIEIFRQACDRAGLAFLSYDKIHVGLGLFQLIVGKAVDIGGELVSREQTITLSYQFLSDLPGMREYQALDSYLGCLPFRLKNPVPWEFMTLLGIPIRVEIDWPFHRAPDRDSSFIRVGTEVEWPENRQANLGVYLSGTVQVVAFPSLAPILTESVVVNAVRKAIDSNTIQFHESARHPTDLQEARITTADYDDSQKTFVFQKATEADIKEFIKRKVYWLGFRRLGKGGEVWIPDPYDANYLGTSPERMQQLAQILAAHDILHLNSEGEFARPSDKLLRDSDRFDEELRTKIARVDTTIQQSEEPRTDVSKPSAFISYSSRDRDWVERLAKDLRAKNLGVWFDKWEIRVGDSLIEKIGKGIRQNDFLIVVLSPNSVDSEWVKKELNEAMQREIREKRVVVLPVLMERCTLPPFLTDKKYADFAKSYEEGLSDLISSIVGHYGSLSQG